MNATRFSRARSGGFTLVDAMLATAICGFALTALFAATGQALHVVKSAREAGCANELLQQRMEAFRSYTPPPLPVISASWSNLLSPTAASKFLTNATAIGSSLPGASETFTISDYPNATNTFTISRSASGAVTTTGSALLTSQRCVKITGQVTWNGWAGLNRSRNLQTIITKSGIMP